MSMLRKKPLALACSFNFVARQAALLTASSGLHADYDQLNLSRRQELQFTSLGRLSFFVLSRCLCSSSPSCYGHSPELHPAPPPCKVPRSVHHSDHPNILYQHARPTLDINRRAPLLLTRYQTPCLHRLRSDGKECLLRSKLTYGWH